MSWTKNFVRTWIGNELQATGNALLADAEETWSLDKFGNQLQEIGNSTVILGLVIDFDEVTKQELIIKGNLIQAVGGGTALAGAYENPDEPAGLQCYGKFVAGNWEFDASDRRN
ncbi:DUF6944 family repetitive protein [Peribacillus sp. NPDC058075]|uniref:DUF6944 family repetitive protein n=1 Tax=unclassified Peribacillus TaxID=2675266 RepID=UPI0036DA4A06